MAQDIFISYSTKDKPIADAICTSLETHGMQCWIAPRDILPGSTWGEAIVNAIRTSQVMVLVLSAQSNDSAQVLREVERAVSKNVPIIPFRIEDVLPSPALEYYISSEHWLDALTPPLENHIQRLVEALAMRLARKAEPAIPAPKKHNLPVQLTSFIGREKELKEMGSLLTRETTRLVTLTGPGGTGKTRLALKAAEGLLTDFPDGVYLVELAPLNDPGLVVGAIAAALGLRESQGRTVQQAVMDFLENKRLLLLLDNCEHLVEECARVSNWLLKGSPGLKLLATSREILGVSGEISVRVPPLELPDGQELPGVETLGQVEAVRLFVERGRLTAPDFTVDDENAAAVVQVCRRLDGIPLALELAAARLRIMSVQQVASRLGDMFRLLTGGSRSALPRQQTLKAAMDWSYALLTEAEKLALMRLSSFAGSWTLEGAEAVCAGEGIQDYEVLDLLGSLVDKSLALLTNEGRYRMLETVRQYAHDRLLEGGKGEEVRDRHLAYYLKLSEVFAGEVRSKKQVEWLNRMDDELDNLRLALEWALAGRVMDGLHLGAALQWLWHLHSHDAEGAAWLVKLLTAEAEGRGSQALAVGVQNREYLLTWVRACSAAVYLGGYTNETRKMMMREAITLCREIGDGASQELAWALQVSVPSSLEEGLQFLEESLRICQHKRLLFLQAHCLLLMSDHRILNGQLQQATDEIEASMALFRKLEDLDGIATCLFQLTLVARTQGDNARAFTLRAEGQEYYRKVGNLDSLNDSYIEQLYNALELGEDPHTYQQAEGALDYFRDKGDHGQLCFALIRFGEVEWSRGNFIRAQALGQEAYTLNLKYPDSTPSYWVHLALGHMAFSLGDLVKTRQEYRLMSEVLEQYQAPWTYVFMLSGWVTLLAAEEKMTQSAKVSGALDETYQHFSPFRVRRDREEYAAAKMAARQALGEEAFAQAWKEGKELSLWQALELARQA